MARADREAFARMANSVLGVACAAAWVVLLVAFVATGAPAFLVADAVVGGLATWLLWGEAEPPAPPPAEHDWWRGGGGHDGD